MGGVLFSGCVSGFGNAAMGWIDGRTGIRSFMTDFAVGFLASSVGCGIRGLTTKVGGKIAISRLSQKTPGQIKKIITSTIHVAGEHRNMVKDVSWTLSQKAYKHLPTALLGDIIPHITGSITAGFANYYFKKGAVKYGYY